MAVVRRKLCSMETCVANICMKTVYEGMQWRWWWFLVRENTDRHAHNHRLHHPSPSWPWSTTRRRSIASITTPHVTLYAQSSHLHKAVVAQQHGRLVGAQVKYAVMARVDVDALAHRNELQPHTSLHAHQLAHRPHYHHAVAAAADGDAVQRRQRVDGGVVAVADACLVPAKGPGAPRDGVFVNPRNLLAAGGCRGAGGAWCRLCGGDGWWAAVV